MLEWLLKKLLGLFSSSSTKSETPEQIDTIKGHDPSGEYLAGGMPTYTKKALIEHFEYRIGIHEIYLDRIVDGSFSPYAGYGDANFQLWAIEGYENAIYYLRGLSGGTD